MSDGDDGNGVSSSIVSITLSVSVSVGGVCVSVCGCLFVYLCSAHYSAGWLHCK